MRKIDVLQEVCGRMREQKKVMEVCGTCKYHHKETVDDGFVCTNPDSDYVADWTEWNDWCSDWEGRYEDD